MQKDREILNCWRGLTAERDSKAFERLFYLMNARLMKYCCQHINNREAAEEIVADVFVYCWTEWDKLTQIENPEAFMFVSVKNRAINLWKKSSHMRLISINEELDEFTDTCRPDDALERKELIMQLDKAVDSLPEQCRIIFRHVKEDGMKCAEVAEILNISVRTVHTHLYRAMNKLNAIMLKYDSLTSPGIVRTIASVIAIIFIYFFQSL